MTKKRFVNAQLKPVLAKLEIATRKTTSPSGIVGKYQSFYKGAGLEFEGFREYTPADDATKIDWKASLRSNEILIKEFAQTRNLLVYMLIDASDSMISGTTEKLKNEYAAEVSAFLAYNILINDDNLGYALYNDEIKEHKLPKRGAKQFYNLSKSLLNPDIYGGKPNLKTALNFVMTFLQRGSVLIVISDFLHMQKDDFQNLKIASSKYDVIAFIIRDPVDYKLPIGMEVLLEDPITKQRQIIDTSVIAKDYEVVSKKMFEDLKNNFLKNNIDFIELRTDKPFNYEIRKFFQMRQKKWK